jgi:hypothetical protein
MIHSNGFTYLRCEAANDADGSATEREFTILTASVHTAAENRGYLPNQTFPMRRGSILEFAALRRVGG